MTPFGSTVNVGDRRDCARHSFPIKSKGVEVAETVVETTPAGEDPSRRDFIHVAALAATAGAVGSVAWPLIDQMNPSGDTLALASQEFDLTKVADGSEVTIKWRGKPVFIRKRTPAEIASAVKDDGADLKDPAKDADRH